MSGAAPTPPATAKGNAVTAITRALDEARLRTTMSPFVIEGLLTYALEELAQVNELVRPRRTKKGATTS